MTATTAPHGRLALGSAYPWLALGLLWCCALLNSADRSILVAVMPQIRDEFHLSPTLLALITSVFFWVYAVAAFITSRLGDRARRSRVIMWGLAFWSIATGLVSLSAGFAMLIGLRAMVAVGEATYYPSATALISDWHPNRTRGRALSLHQTGVFAGAGLGSLAAGLIADRMGWRAPFLIFAVAGGVMALVLMRLLKDAPAHEAQAAAAPAAGSGPLSTVLATRSALALCAVFFLGNAASNGVTVWAPTFVHDKLHINLAQSALWGSATINIAGFVFVPLGGMLADALSIRSKIGRFYTLAIGLGLAGLLLLPLLAANSALMVGLVLLASSAGKGLFDGCIYAAMHDVVPARARATAVGLMTMTGFVGAGLAPLFVAQMGQLFGMAAAMTSVAGLYFGAVLILLACRDMTRNAILDHEPEPAAA
ncbi:MFS transporter [Phenylobacterium sp.]|uniref:MFS transporter n=1 Tax=Phenylobacterium sp. TaxID=1871053 RepID=UPI002DEE1A6C|nr:MFS transporter [Phenylobacterium sp.]